MAFPVILTLTLTLALTLTLTSAHPNFATCKAQFFNGTFQSLNVTPLDTSGQPVSYANLSSARGMSYHDCVRACGGTGDEAFSWSVFSQQFNAWLVPWLALFSQLPFTASGRWDNVASALLTMGSPALAVYSLTLTSLNTHWLAKKFGNLKTIPNAKQAAVVLSALQHIPIDLKMEDGLLASLVVLRENDDWWKEMSEKALRTRHWNVPAAVNILWVILSFVFTLVDSYQDFGSFISSHGHAVASVWMWLVPIVIGWLQVGCQSDANHLRRALASANERAFVAAPANTNTNGSGGEPRLVRKGTSRAIEQAGVPLAKKTRDKLERRSRLRFSSLSGAVTLVGNTFANLTVPPANSADDSEAKDTSGSLRSSPNIDLQHEYEPKIPSHLHQTTALPPSYDRPHHYQADAHRTAPVFNYARSWLWTQQAEHIWMMFWAADVRARKRLVVRGTAERLQIEATEETRPTGRVGLGMGMETMRKRIVTASTSMIRRLSRGPGAEPETIEVEEQLEPDFEQPGHNVELEWEHDDSLQTRNYTGTQDDVIAYCFPFGSDLDEDSGPAGVVRSGPSPSPSSSEFDSEKVDVAVSDRRLEEASGSGLTPFSFSSVPFSQARGSSSSSPNFAHPHTQSYPHPSPILANNSYYSPLFASHVFLHTFIASALGLFLQWATSGSAILISALTPTTGLGCRSAAYLAYTVLGTLSFGCILVSSWLAHFGRLGEGYGERWNDDHRHLTLLTKLSSLLSTPLRRLGKVLGYTNALWILAASLFQFSSIYNTCWCESSALSRGANKAYILFLTGDDLIGLGVRKVWIGGVVGAAGACAVYLGFVQFWMGRSARALKS